jgi:hypothetical protein
MVWMQSEGARGGRRPRPLYRADNCLKTSTKEFITELTERMSQPRPPYNYNMPNGAAGGHPISGAAPLLPNQGRIVQTGGVRVLCIADVRGEAIWIHCRPTELTFVGNLRSLNELAKQARADHIIHTGDFGFYDESSLDRIAEK